MHLNQQELIATPCLPRNTEEPRIRSTFHQPISKTSQKHWAKNLPLAWRHFLNTAHVHIPVTRTHQQTITCRNLCHTLLPAILCEIASRTPQKALPFEGHFSSSPWSNLDSFLHHLKLETFVSTWREAKKMPNRKREAPLRSYWTSR